jgi:hypothetical protein
MNTDKKTMKLEVGGLKFEGTLRHQSSNIKPQTSNYLLYLCSSVFICGSLLGCAPRRAAAIDPYRGPTLTLNEVVNKVNANNDQLGTLRSEGSFEANINDNGKMRFLNGEVTLLYSQPDSMRLIGKKDIAGQIFEIATNPERYWVIVRGDQDTMWTGTYANIANADPRQIPIRPDLVMEVLGITPINTNLMQPPVPVMRFNNDAHAYMLVWQAPAGTHWAAQKEIWYDLKTLLPKYVFLFDVNGRIVLRAYLGKHEPVEVPGVPQDQWPKVATSYQLLFAETQSTIKIELSKENLALKRNNAPNERSFIFPGDNAGVSRTIDLDRSGAR